MKILPVLIIAACLSGCTTFRDQVDECHPYAKIVITSPDKDEFEIREEEVPGLTTIIWVDKIDGIPVRKGPGLKQTFRIRPGQHEIAHEVTTVEISPIDGSMIMGKITERGTLEETQIRYTWNISRSHSVTNVTLEAGKSYVLEDAMVRQWESPSQKILGDWTLDVEATMAENSMLSNETRDAIRKGMEMNPFDLSITNGMYVSRGKAETISDKYEVVSIKNNESISIRLTSGRVTGTDRRGTKTLTIRNGKLVIPGPNRMKVVMKRPAKKQDNTVNAPADEKGL